jgi:hypothetical protein
MAADQLFPIVMKPGILRDGTKFQGEFCTEGQWVRFYRGMPKKIGGMKAIQGAGELPTNVTGISIFNIPNQSLYFLANNTNIYAATTNIAAPFIFTGEFQAKVDDFDAPNVLWQVINVNVLNVGSNVSYIFFMGCNILNDIFNNTAPFFYVATIENNAIESVALFEPEGIELNVYNGGLCQAGNFLFLYGSNGQVAYSERNKYFSFKQKAEKVGKEVDTSSGRIKISNDKVIFGSSTRGGNNSPTVLFWTISSLVKLSNQSNDNSEDAGVEFDVDVLSTSISVLSTRCIVEYDGIFFWLGIDRIFLFNGAVREVQNNMNFNYFFSNLDKAKRQLVFAVKNSLKGEIWWYYPEVINAGNPAIGCTRALVYNIRDNFWYDTQVTRNCGILDTNSGKMITYGPALVNPNLNQIWVHEEGINQVDQDNHAVGIPSSFTTPTFSFASFNPIKQMTGIDRWTILKRLEPDFKLPENTRMTMVVNTKEYATSNNLPHEAIIIDWNAPKVDFLIQGRLLSLTFSTTGDFEMGHVMLLMNIGDGQ